MKSCSSEGESKLADGGLNPYEMESKIYILFPPTVLPTFQKKKKSIKMEMAMALMGQFSPVLIIGILLTYCSPDQDLKIPVS